MFDLELFFELNFTKVYKFFYFKVLNKNIAEDLTSETFVLFTQKIKSEKQIDNHTAYLFGIAQNIFIKHLKSKYKNEIVFSDLDISSIKHIEEFVKDVEEISTIEKFALKYINQLPPKQKDVLKLRLIDKKTLSQIAEFLEKDMNYVKTTQKRGIKNLKKILLCTPFFTKDI